MVENATQICSGLNPFTAILPSENGRVVLVVQLDIGLEIIEFILTEILFQKAYYRLFAFQTFPELV